jgi:hypothetical protein
MEGILAEMRPWMRMTACILTDRLTFEPRLLPPLVTWFTRRLFTHRHAVLRRRFGSAD